MIELIIKDKIKIPLKSLSKTLIKELKDMFTMKNPTYYKMRAAGFRPTENQYIRTFEIDKKFISLPRGSFQEILNIFEREKLKFKIIDQRIVKPFKFKSTIKLKEYQLEPVNEAVKAEQGIIKGVCSSGKTIMLIQTMVQLGQRTLIIVPTKKLQDQWVKNLKGLISTSESTTTPLIASYGGGKKEIGIVTVGIINSVSKDVKKLSDIFGTVIGDEIHRAAAPMFLNIVNHMKAKYRIGGTATPYRKDGKQFLMFQTFGPVVASVEDSDLEEAGDAMEVEIRVIPTDFYYDPKEIGEEYERIDYNEFLNQIVNDEERNQLIFRFLKKEYDKGNYSILLADRLEFCHNWKEELKKQGIKAKLAIGGLEEEYKLAQRLIEKGKLRVLIGTAVADEGLDISQLNRGFICTPTVNNKRRIVQQAGRMKRRHPGKVDAICYYVWDKNVFDDSVLDKLKSYFKTVKVFSLGKWYSVRNYKKILIY